MAFVIIDSDGQPLTDLAGVLIVVATEQEARQFLKPGERVERYSGKPPEPSARNRAVPPWP
jgi:hypothetical protein